MEKAEKTPITVETLVQAPVEKVWTYWSSPEHIAHWCFATDEWHAPHAENDLRVDGKFKTVMAAKDGSAAFDFEGVYTEVKEHELVAYVLGDGRKVRITFSKEGNATKLTETFDPESTHAEEMQRAGWQSILDNFKRYTEAN